MTQYYISASGNDANSGLSPATSWATVGKVNGFAQQPGDFYQFNGGDTFTGTTLIPSASGTAGNPITFQSYGTGRATINIAGITADGFTATDRSNITVNNLNFTGPGTGAANTHKGVHFTYTTSGPLPNINVTNCNVSGFGGSGIDFEPQSTSTNIISGILIDNCVVSNCTWGDNGETSGIHFESWIVGLDTGIYQLQNITISRCVAHDCPGLAGSSPTSGNGIFVRAVYNCLITQCVAYNNCLNTGGGLGMWTFDSQNVTFQYCESYNNKGPPSASDGGGFDIDGGCVNCIIQYCYSHGNWGNGFLIFGGSYHSGGGTKNCIIRFCVSENDGQNAARAHQGIAVVSNGGQKTLNAQVYGNTVYFSQGAGGSCFDTDAQSGGGAETQVQVLNNIFWATTSGNSCVSDTVFNETGLQTTTYAGNCYYGPFAVTLIDWNGTFYQSLAVWQAATGQEEIGTSSVGFQGDPRLANPGGGGTVNTGSYVTPAMLATLTAYTINSNSPVFRRGVDITKNFGASIPATDFYGNLIVSSSLSIGSDCPILVSTPKVPDFIPGREWQMLDAAMDVNRLKILY